MPRTSSPGGTGKSSPLRPPSAPPTAEPTAEIIHLRRRAAPSPVLTMKGLGTVQFTIFLSLFLPPCRLWWHLAGLSPGSGGCLAAGLPMPGAAAGCGIRGVPGRPGSPCGAGSSCWGEAARKSLERKIRSRFWFEESGWRPIEFGFLLASNQLLFASHLLSLAFLYFFFLSICPFTRLVFLETRRGGGTRLREAGKVCGFPCSAWVDAGRAFPWPRGCEQPWLPPGAALLPSPCAGKGPPKPS